MTVETLLEYGLRRMDDKTIDNFLRHQGVGVLGFSTNGLPYLLPMAFGYDGDDRLYFSFFVDEPSRKAELAERTDRAAFLVYTADSMFAWESVRLEGSIRRLPENWDANPEALSNAWRLDVFERAESAGELRLYEFQVDDREGYTYAEVPPGFEPA
ncbi:MAG: pyridoxamine 5'-phosphate oxidase family protein [Salinirussus sp.]